MGSACRVPVAVMELHVSGLRSPPGPAVGPSGACEPQRPRSPSLVSQRRGAVALRRTNPAVTWVSRINSFGMPRTHAQCFHKNCL